MVAGVVAFAPPRPPGGEDRSFAKLRPSRLWRGTLLSAAAQLQLRWRGSLGDAPTHSLRSDLSLTIGAGTPTPRATDRPPTSRSFDTTTGSSPLAPASAIAKLHPGFSSFCLPFRSSLSIAATYPGNGRLVCAHTSAPCTDT